MPSEFDKTSSNFWSEFLQATEATHPMQVKKASNMIRVSGVNFPSINTQTLEEYFIRGQSSSNSTLGFRVVFHCCTFEDFESSKLDIFLDFDGCTFSKDIIIESSGKPMTFERTKFNGKTSKFTGVNTDPCQAQFSECVFNSEVVLEGFYFLNIPLRGSGNIPSKFNQLNFKKTLTLKRVTFPKEMAFFGVSWPRKINADRDIFRQLKVCMEEQKNALQANVFHSLEMNEYRKELFSGERSSLSNWSDKFIFLLSWAISDFTLSWFRPLLLILITSVFFFMIACGVDAFNHCGFNGFFHFINPFNRTTDHYYSVYSVWFIHKIVLIILSYHLVVAVKRKTKY
jgi:hypothetical protein